LKKVKRKMHVPKTLVRELPGEKLEKTSESKIVLIESMRSSLLLGLPDDSRRRALALLAAPLLFISCAKKKSVRVPPAPRVGALETGIASWYGPPYHGRRAAGGEIYDMEKLTAAHRTLPFNTWVEVTNLTNGKKVRVRITDRGPFVGGRIVDLSRAAAREIDMVGAGIAKVRLEIISPPENPPGNPPSNPTVRAGLYAVQVGAYLNRAAAERMQKTLQSRYQDCNLVRRDGETVLWRVLIGREATEQAAHELAGRLRLEFGEAFVVRLDDAAADSL
jgi:rare lipoprotein A